jgi:hypothetical protein
MTLDWVACVGAAGVDFQCFEPVEKYCFAAAAAVVESVENPAAVVAVVPQVSVTRNPAASAVALVVSELAVALFALVNFVPQVSIAVSWAVSANC